MGNFTRKFRFKGRGDFEKRPDEVKMMIISNKEGKLIFKAPKEKGVYRLFGYVDDDQQHAVMANIPFIVY